MQVKHRLLQTDKSHVILYLLYPPQNDLIENNVVHPLEKYFVTSIELVWEVERYWPEIVGPPSMHILGSGTHLLERGCTLFYSTVVQGFPQ